MEDSKIVQLYLDRDEDAIKHTSDKYGNMLRNISYGIISDYQVAEECENDTYMEGWRRIPPNEPRDYFSSFLIRIVRHISIDRCREKTALKREKSIISLSEELEQIIPGINDVEEVIDEKILGEAINRYLQTVSTEKRVIFMRRYFYLDSISSIAERMNLRESKVKTTLFRMRNSLRDFLEKEGFDL